MNYQPVTLAQTEAAVHLPPDARSDPPALDREAPARWALSDFRKSPAITVDAHRQIDAALQDMITASVRSLLVTKNHALIGFITSYDIMGEKPLQYIQGPCVHEHCGRQDVGVEDIMTPIADVPSVVFATLAERHLGDLIVTFDAHPDWMHLLVIEPDGAGGCQVRGLISRTRIARLLSTEVAHA